MYWNLCEELNCAFLWRVMATFMQAHITMLALPKVSSTKSLSQEWKVKVWWKSDFQIEAVLAFSCARVCVCWFYFTQLGFAWHLSLFSYAGQNQGEPVVDWPFFSSQYSGFDSLAVQVIRWLLLRSSLAREGGPAEVPLARRAKQNELHGMEEAGAVL